jgi:hypothetical protein
MECVVVGCVKVDAKSVMERERVVVVRVDAEGVVKRVAADMMEIERSTLGQKRTRRWGASCWRARRRSVFQRASWWGS